VYIDRPISLRYGEKILSLTFVHPVLTKKAKEIMLYKDFKNAARKHLNTCTVLEEKYHITTNTPEIKKSILLNVYYLSGYTIECMVKYGIYDLIGYDKDKDIKLLAHPKLNYPVHIKHHKFERYTEHLVKYISCPIPLINCTNGINDAVVRLYNNWDAEVRYKYDLGAVDERHYLDFFYKSKKIFQVISNNIRG
jgi:hypothetical protein